MPVGAHDAFTPQSLSTCLGELREDGVTACRGAFPTAWADRVREDIEAAFAEAIARPDGAVGRGQNRCYVEIHPEQLRGFADLAGHPWVRAISEAVLGPDHEIVELGFDIPFAGAYRETLPAGIRDHLRCPVVDALTPIAQKHTIEGLVMGDA